MSACGRSFRLAEWCTWKQPCSLTGAPLHDGVRYMEKYLDTVVEVFVTESHNSAHLMHLQPQFDDTINYTLCHVVTVQIPFR